MMLSKCPKCGGRVSQIASRGGYYCLNYSCLHSVGRELITAATYYPPHRRAK